MELINVAVTGLNSSQSPSPGIGIIRSLRAHPKARVSITAIAYEMFSDGIHSLPLADRVVELPFPSSHPEAFLKKLTSLRSRLSLHCLIPTIDAEVPALSRLEPEMRKIGIKVLLPREESVRSVCKERLAGWGPAPNFSVPRSAVLYSRDDLPYYSRILGWPLVLKGPLGEVRVAHTAAQAGVYFDQLARTWGTPVILQSAVQGEEYAVACLADPRHEVLGLVVMKKVIQDDGGTTWAGVTVQEPGFRPIAEQLVKDLQWVGPLEMEFIKEIYTGRYYLLEINNRFPAWIFLATRAGQNLPLACLQLALGKKLRPLPAYQAGLLYIRVADDLVTDLDSLGGLLTKGEWNCHGEKEKRSLRKTRHRP